MIGGLYDGGGVYVGGGVYDGSIVEYCGNVVGGGIGDVISYTIEDDGGVVDDGDTGDRIEDAAELYGELVGASDTQDGLDVLYDSASKYDLGEPDDFKELPLEPKPPDS